MTTTFNPEEQYKLAMEAYQGGQITMALQYMKEIIAYHPDNDSLLGDYGGMLMAKGDFQEAEEVLSKAMGLNPNNENILINLAMVYRAKGQFEAAINIINGAMTLNPSKPELHFNLGNLYFDMGRLNQAKASLEYALELKPTLLGANYHLGVIALREGEPAKAIDYLKKVLEYQPNLEPALLEMGNAHADLAKETEAITYYEKALKVNPKSFIACNYLGKLYVEQGNYEKAAAILQQSLAINPEVSDTHLMLGHIAQSLQNNDAASRHYEKALVINPQNKSAKDSLAKVTQEKVPSWHFTMLADQERNDAYQKAIEKAVQKDDVVLDIGTGSGLLSMMAAKAGAKKVVACEMNPILAKAAKEIVDLNGFAETIDVFAKKSNELNVGTEMLQKATVLVSEILDASVIGEGVLPSLRHAKANLLTENVKIIPAQANVFAQLIEVPAMSRITPLRNINGFDLSPFNRFRREDKFQVVQLQTLEHQYLSDVFPVINYDFYKLPAAIQESQPQEKIFDIKVEQDGELQGVSLWFDLHLDDEIMVSSRPGGELVHWGQALFCFENPKTVQKGETIQLKLKHSDLFLKMKLV